MTALKEVLEAEKEADQAIENTKKEVEAEITAAIDEQQSNLEAETAKLQKSGEDETKAHQERVEKLVQKIATDTEAQVKVIEEQFSDKKNSVKTILMKQFQ